MGLGPQWIAKLWAICHCQSMIEVCVSSMLFMVWLSVFLHIQTGGNICTPAAETTTVFRALVVSKSIRTLAAAAVPNAGWRGPRWPKVCLFCGGLSCLTLCGEIFCMLAWQTACGQKDLEVPMARGVIGMATDSLIAFLSFVCSGAWCVITFRKTPRMPPLRVASFVVHDVPTECGDALCSICLDEFAPDCRAARLPCGHIFHDACVREWLKTGRHRNCPMRCPRPHAHVARQGGSLPAGMSSEHDPARSHEEADSRPEDRQDAVVV